jgi:hypothetical protein
MNVNELVKEFADCVVAQEAALAKADPITGNKFARRCNAAFEQLRSLGDEGRDALAVLLDDNRPEVRVMAAAHLLRHCEDRAKAVLEAESRGSGLVAFGAAQALQRWEDGTWALVPE